ncbi:MAG TPA: tyrosine-type recombinase/integrase [Thermoanaerobacterales bacterium]|nr:tyrosine-type recombinase/integrase [Thermoanaerobacterales bacterium]
MDDLSKQIECVLAQHRKENIRESTLKLYQLGFNRLLRLAKSMGICSLTQVLENAFLADNLHTVTGRYSSTRHKLHKLCIRKLVEYNENAYRGWRRPLNRNIDKPGLPEYRQIHQAFLAQLHTEGKSKGTVESYRNISCKFLLFAEQSDVLRLEDISEKTVVDFFVALRASWAAESLRTAASGLRTFFRFIEVDESLLYALPRRLPRKTAIVDPLTEDEESRIWSYLAVQKLSMRDKAITGLIMLTGLRAVDVAGLQFNDVDWFCNTIYIVQSKTKKALVLPLLPRVGNDIAKYICLERPTSTSQHIFLTQKAPFRPIGRGLCYHIVSKILRRSEVPKRNCGLGPRFLRHHVASKMMNKGVSKSTISAVLGHTNPDSVDVYISTREDKLRSCNLPLDGIPMQMEVLRP